MSKSSTLQSSSRKMTGREKGLLLVLVVWLAFMQFEQWPVLVNGGFDNRDCAIYTYCGHLITQGETLYGDFWDQKPPLIYLINALALTIFNGWVGGPWVFALFTLWISLLLCYFTLRRWSGIPAAMFGAVIFSASLLGVYVGGNITESYALPLQWAIVLIALLWRDKRQPGDVVTGLLIGILGTLCFGLRQNLIGTPVAVVLTIYLTLALEKNWTSLLRVIAGKALGVSLVAAPIFWYLASQGALAHFWDAAFLYNFKFKTSGPVFEKIVGHLSMFDYVPAIGLALLLYLLTLYSLWRRDRFKQLFRTATDSNEEQSRLFRQRLLIIWLPVAMYFATVSGQAFNHYYMTLLPVSTILVAATTARLIGPKSNLRSSGKKTWIVLVAVIVLLTVVKHHRQIIRDLHNDRVRQIEATADYVRTHTGEDDAIFVWGVMPDIYLLSERDHASKYTIIYPLLAPGYAGPVQVGELITDVKTKNPSLIIDTSPKNRSIPPLHKWDREFITFDGQVSPALEMWYLHVSRNYTLTDTVGEWGWHVFRKNDTLIQHEIVQDN